MFRRKRQWAQFAERWEDALAEAETRLEFRLACIGNDVGFGVAEMQAPGRPGGDDETSAGDGAAEAGGSIPFDPEFALKFLKWREEKRRGGGQRGRLAREPDIEEVRAEIMRKVEAIERHAALVKSRAAEPSRGPSSASLGAGTPADGTR